MPCGKAIDARGLHGLSCRKIAARLQIHSQLNDIIWWAVKIAQIPAEMETVGISRDDGMRPDGATLIPWERGKAFAWDVTVVDTFAQSHIGDTSSMVDWWEKRSPCRYFEDLKICQHNRHKHFSSHCH